eukprot:2519256-Rhodomonas_salina.1
MRQARREVIDKLDKVKMMAIHQLMHPSKRGAWQPLDIEMAEPMNESERASHVGTICASEVLK